MGKVVFMSQCFACWVFDKAQEDWWPLGLNKNKTLHLMSYFRSYS